MLFAVAWATSLVGTPLGGWLADRFGRKAVIVPAFGIATVALGSIALSNSWLGFAVPLGLWSFAGSIAMPALSAYSVEVSPLAQRGQALALQRQASDMVWVFAPVGLGLPADAVSYLLARRRRAQQQLASGYSPFGPRAGPATNKMMTSHLNWLEN